jgi:hypothetical protein
MDLKDQENNIILSTAYLPPLSYVKAMQTAENCFIENQETYQRQSYRNRTHIYSPNGKLALIIPVKAKNHSKIDEVEIDYSTNWQMQHWRSITAAYSNAAFFIHYEERLSRFFKEKKQRFLLDFNMNILHELNAIFGIHTPIKYTENFEKNYSIAKDFRNSIHPKKQTALSLPEYFQVFQDKHSFIKDLSIIDYLFNMGPQF